MLLRNDSILRHLPAFEKKLLLVLDSLRFTLEMIDYSYIELEKRIVELSTKKKDREYPALFLYCWNILDNSRRFIRLYKTLPSNNDHKYIKIIEYINSPRNTYQHLDERIEESLISSKQPFYGTLKWSFSNKITGKTENFIAVSGIHYTENHGFVIGKYDESNTIQDLILETVDRNDKTEINLSQFYLDLKTVIAIIEKDFTKQINDQKLQTQDWRRKRDILIKLKRE